jgi:transketolase
MALYSTLAIKGFIDIKELDTYGQSGSRLMAHISHKVPGVEFSTGSLGHGLPFAAGKALAAKKTGLEWRTFVLLGDGELDEGSNWEALLFSAHHKLSNLTVIVDANNLQSLTSVEETIGLEPMADKFRAFNCEVSELNGHSHEELKSALSQNPSGTQKPHVVIARTVKGKGVSFMENTVEWHYRNPNDSQLSDALLEVRSAN